MVGLPTSTTTDNEFYSLEEQGGCVNAIITSAWASKEDLGGGGSEGSGSTRSDNEIPLDRIHVRNEVEVDTREVDDGCGILSPVHSRRAPLP